MALTDSLRSLQSLLNEDQDDSRVEPKVAPEATDDEVLIQDTENNPVLGPTDIEDDIPILVDTFDDAPTLRPGPKMELPSRDQDDLTTDNEVADGTSTMVEITLEYPEDGAESQTQGLVQDAGETEQDETPTFDNIPVLTDIAYIPKASAPSRPTDEEVAKKEALIEASIDDINRRIELSGAKPLREEEKETLRQTLALLLVTRDHAAGG